MRPSGHQISRTHVLVTQSEAEVTWRAEEQSGNRVARRNGRAVRSLGQAGAATAKRFTRACTSSYTVGSARRGVDRGDEPRAAAGNPSGDGGGGAGASLHHSAGEPGSAGAVRVVLLIGTAAWSSPRCVDEDAIVDAPSSRGRTRSGHEPPRRRQALTSPGARLAARTLGCGSGGS